MTEVDVLIAGPARRDLHPEHLAARAPSPTKSQQGTVTSQSGYVQSDRLREPLLPR
jgi:hypothetical protein